MGKVCCIDLCDGAIDSGALEHSVSEPSKGGVVTFKGVVRQDTEGQKTDKLFYEAHGSMALAQMRRVAEEAAKNWDANVAVAHRLGELQPGEVAVVCVAACGHRSEAFECCRFLIDRIKADVPIWKKEFGPSGEEWISG